MGNAYTFFISFKVYLDLVVKRACLNCYGFLDRMYMQGKIRMLIFFGKLLRYLLFLFYKHLMDMWCLCRSPCLPFYCPALPEWHHCLCPPLMSFCWLGVQHGVRWVACPGRWVWSPRMLKGKGNYLLLIWRMGWFVTLLSPLSLQRLIAFLPRVHGHEKTMPTGRISCVPPCLLCDIYLSVCHWSRIRGQKHPGKMNRGGQPPPKVHLQHWDTSKCHFVFSSPAGTVYSPPNAEMGYLWFSRSCWTSVSSLLLLLLKFVSGQLIG